MSEEKLDEIKKKKKQLQAELDRIQYELDHSFDEVRSDVSDKLKPAEIIKNHPLPIVGLSVLLGFLAGHNPKRNTASSKSSSNTKDGFTSLLYTELKKLATRKAVKAATDYIDQFLDTKEGEMVSGPNGTGEGE